jgi:hypothetical protein
MCIFTINDLELICHSGNDSPTVRPKFLDQSFNTIRRDVEQVNEGERNSDETMVHM